MQTAVAGVVSGGGCCVVRVMLIRRQASVCARRAGATALKVHTDARCGLRRDRTRSSRQVMAARLRRNLRMDGQPLRCPLECQEPRYASNVETSDGYGPQDYSCSSSGLSHCACLQAGCERVFTDWLSGAKAEHVACCVANPMPRSTQQSPDLRPHHGRASGGADQGNIRSRCLRRYFAVPTHPCNSVNV